MLNTAILDIVIALTFTYFILSMMVSSLHDAIASAWNLKGKLLEKSLLNLFYKEKSGDAKTNASATTGKTVSTKKQKEPETEDWWEGYLDQILDSPFIDSVRKKADQFPSYIPPKNFTLATMDFLKKQVTKDDKGNYVEGNLLQQLKKDLENEKISPIKGKFRTKLLTFLDRSQNDLEAFKNEIEEFYTNSTEQLSGWYKRNVKKFLFFYGFAFALVFNVDTFHMGKVLWQKPSEATEFVTKVQDYQKKETMTAADSTLQEIAKNTVNSINENYGTLKPLPIGWNEKEVEPFAKAFGLKSKSKTKTTSATLTTKDSWFRIFAKIFGWLVTAAAVSLGAPFWYQLFNKLLNVRKAIAPASSNSAPPPTNNDNQSNTENK